MDSGGANITPDKLPAKEAEPLFEICDHALADIIKLLKPLWVIGVGSKKKKRIDKVRGQFFGGDKAKFSTARILHPSPANPKANAGWDMEVVRTLTELGVWDFAPCNYTI
jgi:single-strand selective monofunctional uracil DNA glycosylase